MLTDQQTKAAIGMYQDGATVDEIVDVLHVATGYIYRLIRQKKLQRQYRPHKTFYCPLPRPKTLKVGLEFGSYKYELGLQKRCRQCREYWPADTEFFYADKYKSTGLKHDCISCTEEKRKKQIFNPTQFDRLLNLYWSTKCLKA